MKKKRQKRQKQKYHTLSEQLKNPINKIIERCKIGTSSTHLDDRVLSWLGTSTSTKSGKVKQC
jgi:hypothetical protein